MQRYRPPPSLDDRLWRHPSEIGQKAPPARRQRWVGGTASALVVASLLSTGLVLGAGNLLGSSGGNRTVADSGTLPTPTFVGTRADAVSVADGVRPAIVQLKVVSSRSEGGSGVIFRSEGLILTSANLVEGATSVTVVLSTGREVEGRVIGSDADSDTAVVQMGGGPYPAAELGSSLDLKVGQMAIALGGEGGRSVSVGTIRALQRDVRTTDGRSLIKMVQLDLSMLPGLSGGPLLDLEGRVAGITSSASTTGAGAERFSFATPLDAALTAAGQLMSTARVIPVWLGIQGDDLDQTAAQATRVDGGAMIVVVEADSPAQRAGLLASDVIVGVDGRAVTSMGGLIALVRASRPGEVCTVDVVRDNQLLKFEVTVVERPLGS